jgi:hypothetical protein
MHYVILGVHSAEVCPMSNAKTKALMLEIAPQIPKLAEENSVKIVAGPYVNREHTAVVIVEAASSEDLDAFLTQSRLPQWNTVRILPSLPVEEAMGELQESSALF